MRSVSFDGWCHSCSRDRISWILLVFGKCAWMFMIFLYFRLKRDYSAVSDNQEVYHKFPCRVYYALRASRFSSSFLSFMARSAGSATPFIRSSSIFSGKIFSFKKKAKWRQVFAEHWVRTTQYGNSTMPTSSCYKHRLQLSTRLSTY
jgi:hypothetical protein